MSISDIPQTPSAIADTISGTVVWTQNLGDKDNISNSLEVFAHILFNTAGKIEVKSAGTAKLASKLLVKTECAHGVFPCPA